ncbi:MAG: SDR family NAD(P)-dependent oxidoreductase [Ferruginibacter sp.]
MPYALITGGSKGIGYAIAEALARRSFDLVLIARHPDALLEAKQILENKYNVHVQVYNCDLSKENSAINVAEFCMENNIDLQILCNSVGIGGSEDYLNSSLPDLQFMVALNIGAMMSLTMELLPLLKKNTPSYILNVSSMAAFAPIPMKNIYSATKSAILYFSYSLRYQLKKHKVSVSVLCPGPVFTKPEIEKVTIDQLGNLGKLMAVSPQRVGEIAVGGLLNKKLVIIPGVISKLMSAVIRVIPRRLITHIYYKMGNQKMK